MLPFEYPKYQPNLSLDRKAIRDESMNNQPYPDRSSASLSLSFEEIRERRIYE
jgi:hypothetical protein